MRLSRNALKNMMADEEDEYSKEKKNEVEGADQEFNFEGKDGGEKGNDDNDTEKG